MPNWVTNEVRLHGGESHIRQLLEQIKKDEFGIGTIDFEKIIPMPDNIFRGALGQKEMEQYGKENWYDWSLANWGTKWNSYGYTKGEDYAPKDGETPYLRFCTAWAVPHPILQKLSEMFPDIRIEHEWADEDIGYNCGRHEYYDGERTEEYYPESERERYEFAARVRDVDLEADYGLYLNASETGYVYIQGDNDLELIEFAGQTAAFTEFRITDADIVKGLHSYHLRHDDEGDFCALEKRVTVNHGGTVITKEPIDLGEQGFIPINEDNYPNFLGEIISMHEFPDYGSDESEDMGMEMKT